MNQSDAIESHELIVIGGGAAGLSGAGFAARLGVDVVLVEQARTGGDCTWTGCIPSKTLIHAARDARARAQPSGSAGPIDLRSIRARIDLAVAQVHAHEDTAALAAQGVTVVTGAATFVDPHTLAVGSRRLSAPKFVICTGAHARLPDVPGLAEVNAATHATIFHLNDLPRRLVVMGAGPIGVELAQSYARVGAQVTLVGPRVLPRERADVAEIVAEALANDGVRWVRGRIERARRIGSAIAVDVADECIEADLLLVAAGRTPNVEGLGLDRAGVVISGTGIGVDAYLRTSARHIWAAGDVTGGEQFTHLAGWQGFQAVRNALLPGRARGFPVALPRVTFCDPEVAHVGLDFADATARFGDGARAHRRPLSLVDRAICDGATRGFLEIVAGPRGEILGATLVAPRAGEMLGELGLAITGKLRLSSLAASVHAYPTWSSALQQMAADAEVDRFMASPLRRLALWLGRRGW